MEESSLENRSIVGQHALTKRMLSNILKVSQEAKAAKRLNPQLIDATVGMLNRESGQLFSYRTVSESLNRLNDNEMFSYSPANGTAEFRSGVIDWVFGKNKEQITKAFTISVIPTTGGSGAISNAVYNFNDFGQKILLPNHYWTPYENIAEEANLGVETFLMFDEEMHFNRQEFRRQALALAGRQHRLFVILNDPCNNPTGLSLSKDDWKDVIDVLNQIARQDIPVILLHDLAYIDYHSAGFDGARGIFETYLDMDERILTIIAFSGSKTFSLYGFRIGAQVGMSKSKSVMEDFCRVGDYSVRARFSSVSRSGMSVIGSIFTNPDKKAAFQAELLEAREILGKRVQLFFECATKYQLTTLPYSGGFFIGVPTENPNIFEDLVKDGVYVITMPGLIRVAISSVPLTDIDRMVQIIKKNA